MGTDNLSVDEIQAQLDELAQSQADLEEALEQRQQQAKYDLAQEIKDLIQEEVTICPRSSDSSARGGGGPALPRRPARGNTLNMLTRITRATSMFAVSFRVG